GHRIQQVFPLLVFRIVEQRLNFFVAQRLHDRPDRLQLSPGLTLCLFRIGRLRRLLLPSPFVGFFLLIVGFHHVLPQNTAVTISRRLRCMSTSSLMGGLMASSHSAWALTPLWCT